MRSKIIGLLCALLLILLIGCEEFPLEGEHYVELSEEPTTEVFLNLLDMPDTLVMVKDTQILYDIDVSNSAAFAIYLVFNDKPYFLGNTSKGTFTIPNNFFASGYVKFEFAVITTTSTGSIADYYKRELLLWKIQKMLRFDNSPTVKLEFTKAEERNGSIYLEWPRYPHENLSIYRIMRTWIPDTNMPPLISYFNLGINDTHITDTLFVGGEIRYKIITRNNYNSQMESSEVSFSGSVATINNFKTISKDTIELTWNKPHFIANAIGYKISVVGNSYEFFTQSTLDTVARITGVEFGYTAQVVLTTLSHDPYNNLSKSTNVYLGEKISGIKKIIDDPTRERTFILNSPHLVKIENNQKDTVLVSFSNDGPTFLSEDGTTLYLSSINSFYEVDAGSLVVLETYPHSINKTMYDLVSAGDKLYICYEYVGGTSGIFVYDKNTKTVIQDLGADSLKLMRRLRVSPNQQYLVESGKGFYLNRINNDGSLSEMRGFTLLKGQINEYESYAIVKNDLEVQCTYRAYYNTLHRFNLSLPDFVPIPNSSLDIKQSFEVVKIDFNSQQFGYYSSTTNGLQFDVRDMETGTLKESFRVRSTNANDIRLYGRYVYLNNYLNKFD